MAPGILGPGLRLFWHGNWIEAPCYARVARSRLIGVERAVSLAPISNAGGRVIERPLAKLLRFLVTDGPRATLRKARSKTREPRYVGDYHVVGAFGRCADSGAAIVCVAPRSVLAAQYLLVHDDLCREVGPGFGAEEFVGVMEALSRSVDLLAATGRQSYLYSGIDPPAELIGAIEEALDGPARTVGSVEWAGQIQPPEAVEADAATSVRVRPKGPIDDRMPVAVLGAGDYVRMEVVPALRRAGLDLTAVSDREPQIAALSARELGFSMVTTDSIEAIESLDRSGLVIVATYHDSHARLASYALDAGHRVLVEKPPVVTREDLDLLLAASARAEGRLEVGYNRRYNGLVRRARDLLAAESGPATVLCSVREVDIEPDHWYLWPNQGTRVTGNLCHWIDLAVFLIGTGAEPIGVTVSAQRVPGTLGMDAERAFSIEFNDGSLATLVPTGRGDGLRGVQEQIEARRGSCTVRIDDLWRMSALRSGRDSRRRALWRDKGHARMYRDVLGQFGRGEPATYPARDLAVVGSVQIAAAELARSGKATLEVTALLGKSLRLPALPTG